MSSGLVLEESINPRMLEKVPESGRRGESKVFEVQSEVWSVISSTVGGHTLSGAIRFIWTQHFQQEEHFFSHPSEFFSLQLTAGFPSAINSTDSVGWL